MRVRSVLVVSGGGFQGLALIRALRSLPDVRIVMCDCYEENTSRYFVDAFSTAPMLRDESEFVDFLFALCEREQISAVFPSTAYELDVLAAHRDAFLARGITVYVSARRLLDVAQDKLELYRWLIGEGLPALPTFASPREGMALLPLLGKPRGGWGGRGAQVVDDVASCERLGPEFESGYAWQPLLRDFDEYSVDFSVSVDGVSSPLGIRRRIRSSGGFAVLCEPTAPSHVTEVAANAARRLAVLGARGVLNFQIMRVGEECWISDLNARVGTSLPLSLVAGSNPVAFLFEEQDRSPPATTSYRRTVRTLVEHAVPMLDLASVRGVVFDLDDTLFDQKDWIFRKLGMTWDVERAILPDRTTFLRMALQIVEEGNRSRLFDAIATELSLSDADRVRLIETYRTARPAGCRLYDDVGPTLMQLRKLGYALGLVTDNPPASQRQKLDVAGLSGCFDAVLLTGEMNKAKPHPDVFSQIGQLLSIEPERLIMVGDNLFRDIHGSLDAGFRHAFHIQRPGGFFNFSHALCADVTSMIRVHSISRLDELLWHLAGMALGHGKP